MALSAVASSHGQHAGTTSLATTLPAGTQVGDLVVMVIDMNGTTTESVDQGWTELAGSPMDDGGVFLKLACWYKVLVGSDTAPTITLGTSRKIRWVQYAIRGADTTTPVLNSGPQIDSGFNGSVTPDALTNAGGATVWSLLLYGGEGSNGTVTPSSGWTSVVSEPGSDFTAYTEISDNQSPGTGTVTPGAYTYGAGHNSAVFHVLIQEAPPPVDYTKQYIRPPVRQNKPIGFGAKFGQLGLFPWEMSAAGGGSVSVTPGTATLTLTKFAPVVLTPRLVIPGTASLTLTQKTPKTIIGYYVRPGNATLSLATFAPVVKTPRIVIPGTAALTLTKFAPTVKVGIFVIPVTANLTITGLAPIVRTPRLVIPGVATLVLTGFAPNLGAGQTVIPGTAHLVLATFAPSVVESNHIKVIPITEHLTLTTHAPTIINSGVIDYNLTRNFTWEDKFYYLGQFVPSSKNQTLDEILRSLDTTEDNLDEEDKFRIIHEKME